MMGGSDGESLCQLLRVSIGSVDVCIYFDDLNLRLNIHTGVILYISLIIDSEW